MAQIVGDIGLPAHTHVPNGGGTQRWDSRPGSGPLTDQQDFARHLRDVCIDADFDVALSLPNFADLTPTTSRS